MQGFLFYLITGTIISYYRLYIADVHPDDPWFKTREKHKESINNMPALVQVFVIIVLSALAIPTLLTDFALFTIDRIKMRKYNSPKVKMDIFEYYRLGLLAGEALSYSSYNRFDGDEADQIEKAFREQEQRIIAYGFITPSLGDFVACYQEGTELPKLRIKGKVYAK